MVSETGFLAYPARQKYAKTCINEQAKFVDARDPTMEKKDGRRDVDRKLLRKNDAARNKDGGGVTEAEIEPRRDNGTMEEATAIDIGLPRPQRISVWQDTLKTPLHRHHVE